MRMNRKSACWLALIVGMWILVGSVRLIPIGGEWQNLSIDTIFLLSIWLIFFIFSFFIASIANFAKPSINIVRGSVGDLSASRWVLRLSIISMVGASLIAYEFAVVRGYGFSTPVAEIRMAEVVNSQLGFEGSWISGVGRLLTPALLVAWVLAILRWTTIRRTAVVGLYAATITVIWQQLTFEGGRFFLATLLVASFVATRLSPFRRSPSKSRTAYRGPKSSTLLLKSLKFFLIFSVAILFFGLVFLQRTQARELDFASIYEIYTDSFSINIPSYIVERLDGKYGVIWFPAIMLWHYLTQGFNELDNLLHVNGFEYAFGLFQFPQVGQILSKLTGANLRYDVFINLPNPGTYLTIYGASYIDFGHVGAIVCAGILGIFTAVSVKRCVKNDLRGVGLCAPIVITLCLFSPIVSLVTNLWLPLLWALYVGYKIRSSSQDIV